MMLYDLPAPAKLNLFLHVLGRRADGYHSLESVFRLVSLSDSISIDLCQGPGISRESTMGATLESDKDLVVRAAKALQAATGTRQGAHIVVQKRIPMGGGLGGGSSDAATTLLALNHLWRTGLNRAQLSAIGLQLGADVPFFLFGQSAFVQGIGEQMTPVALADSAFVVAQPPVEVATARIFGDPNLTRDSEPVKILDFSGCSRFIASVSSKGFGRNDLEPVAVRIFPVVEQARSWLLQQGLAVRLSGSGGCWFAEFDRPEQARLTCVQLLDKIQSVSLNEGLGRVPLQSVTACDGLPEHPLRHWIND
jgi:4-diphosphocytidyl-2-C-methyl-D-erythritol kinase